MKKPKKKLPIYTMSINEDGDSSVNYVALVDSPATERNWFAFSKQMKFKVDAFHLSPLIAPEAHFVKSVVSPVEINPSNPTKFPPGPTRDVPEVGHTPLFFGP